MSFWIMQHWTKSPYCTKQDKSGDTSVWCDCGEEDRPGQPLSAPHNELDHKLGGGGGHGQTDNDINNSTQPACHWTTKTVRKGGQMEFVVLRAE